MARIVTDFIQTVADSHGAAALEGAIVFVAMDRELDKMIQSAMGLDCYHPGHASPWSHCFLIAEPFNGPSTKILDCTIRNDDKSHTIKWQPPTLVEFVQIITNHAGRVYDASDGVTLGDYDDVGHGRVHPAGVRLIETLTTAERRAIVAAGQRLKADGIHYDFVGLFHVLLELLLHVPVSPDSSYFCSAFCQEAYRYGLGGPGGIGDFKVGVNSHDVSPDDIWYSRTGTAFPRYVPPPSVADVRKFARVPQY